MTISDNEREFYASVITALQQGVDPALYSTPDLQRAYYLAALDGAIPSGPSGGVTSVNGYSGAVTLDAAAIGAVPTGSEGAANGIAQLGSDGKLLASQMPVLQLTDQRVVANQAAMLAISGAVVGTMAIRTDQSNRIYALAALPASTLANWLDTAQNAPVTSVAGKTGVVSLAKGDVGLANVDNTSDVNKPVSTAQATAIATAKAEVNPFTRGVRPRVVADSSTTFPTRASVIPPGYVGLVDYDSMEYPAHPAPSDHVTGDGWFEAV